MGVREELEVLYRAHGPSVLRRARAILGNEAEAQEVLQDLFAGFAAEPKPLLKARSPVGFLYQATTHRCLNTVRNASSRLRLLDARACEVAPRRLDDGPEVRALTRDALLHLDEDSAKAAIYFHIDGMTHAEIAELLDCSRRHVGNLLQRLPAAAAPQEHR